jgi:hypothetical protein
MMESEFHHPLVSLLRLQYTIICILLSTCGPDRELEYDKHTPQFEECIALAGAVAASSYSSYPGSSSLNNQHSCKPTSTAAPATPSFTPEIGIVPVLYIIGVKCRHPLIRREALNILRRHRIREAVWDSVVTARVVERVIEVEEGSQGQGQGHGQETGKGGLVQSAADIPVDWRVQALSFVVNAGGAGGRVDISYMFCAREGLYVESLVI